MLPRWRPIRVRLQRECSEATLLEWYQAASSLFELVSERNHPIFADVPQVARRLRDSAYAGVADRKAARSFARRRDHCVRILLALQERMRHLGSALRHLGHPSGGKIAGCRPWPGEWVRGGRIYEEEAPAGTWMCWSLLCPWCWMRRVAAARRMLEAPPDSKVKDETGCLRSSGMGVGLPWRVTCCSFPAGRLSADDRREFDEACRGLWRNRMQPEGRIGVPEFLHGLCLRSLWCGSRRQVGFLAGVVHGAPLSLPDRGRFGDVQFVRREFARPETALRWAFPFPAGLLDRRPEDLKDLLEGPLRRRRSRDRIEILPSSATAW